ncbi:MAG: hypothetical protein HOV83_27560, partial [Catenulispora sp.]|nr:hypothetical protein [Catenulispora sp.]
VPSTTSEATETVVAETGASASDSPSPLPLAAGNTDGGGLGLGSVLVLGGGALLVGVGGVIMWRLLRKDPEDDLEDETQTFSRQYPRHSR